jgi:hypothetical protein
MFRLATSAEEKIRNRKEWFETSDNPAARLWRKMKSGNLVENSFSRRGAGNAENELNPHVFLSANSASLRENIFLKNGNKTSQEDFNYEILESRHWRDAKIFRSGFNRSEYS